MDELSVNDILNLIEQSTATIRKELSGNFKYGYGRGIEDAMAIVKEVLGTIEDASNGRYNACTEILEKLQNLKF